MAGPGASLGVIGLQTTFGIAWTGDGGRAWHLVCEAGLGLAGTWDPALAIAADRSIIVGLQDGVGALTAPYCAVERPAVGPMDEVFDLASDPTGRQIVAAFGPLGMPNGVWLSADAGRSWTRGATRTDFYIENVDVAPSRPTRVYASGYLRGALPIVLRSDDGGRTFVDGARDFLGGYSAFLIGVDAMRPDVVYVRSDLTSGGTMLLRSDDGGSSFRELTRTIRPMTGAAVGEVSGTMWVGSDDPIEGLQRSTDDGRSWRRVMPGFGSLCLRHHGGVLFACTDEARNGFALAASVDDGDTFLPLLSWTDLRGADLCPERPSGSTDGGTPVGNACAPSWPTLRMSLIGFEAGARPMRVPLDVRFLDAPVDDGAVDDIAGEVGADAGGDSGVDATVPFDAVDAPVVFDAAGEIARDDAPRRAGCQCRAGRTGRGSASGGLIAVVIAVVLAGLIRRASRGTFSRRRRN